MFTTGNIVEIASSPAATSTALVKYFLLFTIDRAIAMISNIVNITPMYLTGVIPFSPILAPIEYI